MLGSLIERLRTLYRADACLLVTVDPATGQYNMRRASRHNPEVVKRSAPITEDVARLLLELPAMQALVSTGKPRWCGW